MREERKNESRRETNRHKDIGVGLEKIEESNKKGSKKGKDKVVKS